MINEMDFVKMAARAVEVFEARHNQKCDTKEKCEIAMKEMIMECIPELAKFC